MLKRLIGEDINLEFLPDDNLWPVKMDPSQLDQILANLCVNSRDAISGVGKIHIETQCVTFDTWYCQRHVECMPGDFVVLTVSDTGCGMDKMTLEKIFEPFFTTKRKDKGTGLGMATVYGIVKQNDGFINVYSEPGHGTTVKIYLPRHLGEEVDTRQENEKKIPFGNNETVLIVEDEIANLDLTKAMLDGIGYVTLASPSPQSAIILAEKTKGNLSLLITDVVMPEMNGKELAKVIQSRCPGIKILFMSGYPSDIVAHKGIVEEGVNFIQKPYSLKNLATKVREVLATSSPA
jgi:CheY-like chemotaxis protein